MNKLICPNCGAEIDASLPKCPYCGFINQEGAEDKFFDDLEVTREKLVELVDSPEAGGAYKDEIKHSSSGLIKKIVIIAVIIMALVMAGITIDKLLHGSGSSKTDYSKEIAWQNEHFPELDKLYEEEKYDELIMKIGEFSEDDHEVWDWNHYYFADAMDDYRCIKSYLKDLDKGDFDEVDGSLLTYAVFKFCYRDYQWNVKDEKDIEILDGIASEVIEIAHKRMGFSDAMLEDFKAKVYKDRYVDWNQSCKIAEKYYKNFK